MKSPRHLPIAAVWMLLLGPGWPLGAENEVVDLGVQQFEAGDLAAARVSLESAVDADSEQHRALAHLGRISLAESDLDAAIDLLERAVELDENDSMYRTWLGRAYIQKLQTVSFFERGVLAGRALGALQKAVKLDPDNVEARISLAGYYLNAPSIAGGSKRKAREQAEEILKVDPAQGNRILAGIHIKNEEYDLAFEKLHQCIEALPKDLECRFQLAMLHQELEQYDDAFRILEQMLEIDPELRGALYQIGRTAVFSSTNLDRGIECLETYLTLEVQLGYPGHDAAHWRLGMLFERRSDPVRARTEYETALRLNPGEKNYKESLQALGGN